MSSRYAVRDDQWIRIATSYKKKRVASGGVSQAPEIQRHGEGSEITLEIMGRVGVVSNGLYQSTNRFGDYTLNFWRKIGLLNFDATLIPMEPLV